MRRNLVVGNWKMKINHQSAQKLIDGLIDGIPAVDADIVVCPPFLYIPEVSQRLANTSISWGAQNVATHIEGAYTGEIAAVMLKDFNCKYAIVGHSERRANYADDDTTVAQRFQQAIDTDIIPVLAIGELLEDREQGRTFDVVAKQLNAVIDFAGIDCFKNAVIAYEPVWAIGTGKTASAEQAQEVHLYIRQLLANKNRPQLRTYVEFEGKSKIWGYSGIPGSTPWWLPKMKSSIPGSPCMWNMAFRKKTAPSR